MRGIMRAFDAASPLGWWIFVVVLVAEVLALCFFIVQKKAQRDLLPSLANPTKLRRVLAIGRVIETTPQVFAPTPQPHSLVL